MVHVHVEKDDLEAKFKLRPVVRVACNGGYDRRTIRELPWVAMANRVRIEKAWNEFFSQSRKGAIRRGYPMGRLERW